MDSEIQFYKELANEIKPMGFGCFLFTKDATAWLYVITPDNSWLYIDRTEYGGYNIIYKYKPSKEFGTGLQYNSEPLYEITTKTLLNAEQYGKAFKNRGWINIPNTYDGKFHRETVWKSPEHYPDGYEAMLKNWCYNELAEL